MSPTKFYVICGAILVLGLFFTVANLLMDGVSFWDFLPALVTPIGISTVVKVRRSQGPDT